MASGAQLPSAVQSFVQWTVLNVLSACFLFGGRLQPNDGQFDLQLAGVTVNEHLVELVESAAFNLESLNEASLLRYDQLVVHKLKVHQYLVYGNGVFAGVVLLDAGQEGLGEEEAAQPLTAGRAVNVPLAEEVHPVLQVGDPLRQRLD
eukprot:CAMPEP_0116896572 /NCGR_PEP_ID=MMETSP0467-20121206/5779_1 /TAXON_ID=283647 /ORGANISM="Mesodinium pulex, Strain SPMC105" /LENGTH=147 /DNA_ID=CAMNT_0004567803 /DNA_START=216 /DNA_END=659 /DNA_ORIENTATION=+